MKSMRTRRRSGVLALLTMFVSSLAVFAGVAPTANAAGEVSTPAVTVTAQNPGTLRTASDLRGSSQSKV